MEWEWPVITLMSMDIRLTMPCNYEQVATPYMALPAPCCPRWWSTVLHQD